MRFFMICPTIIPESNMVPHLCSLSLASQEDFGRPQASDPDIMGHAMDFGGNRGTCGTG